MTYPNLQSIGHTCYCGSISPSKEIVNRAKLMTWDIVCVTFGLRLFWVSYHTTTVHYKFSQAPHPTLLLPFELGLVKKMGACPGFEYGNSHTSNKNHTPTHIPQAHIMHTMSQWWNICWELSMDKHPLPSVPQGHDDSPIYTQTVASDSPYTWELQSPSLQFKRLLPILLLGQQACHFGDWSIFWSYLFHHETKRLIWVTQFKWSQ